MKKSKEKTRFEKVDSLIREAYILQEKHNLGIVDVVRFYNIALSDKAHLQSFFKTLFSQYINTFKAPSLEAIRSVCEKDLQAQYLEENNLTEDFKEWLKSNC